MEKLDNKKILVIGSKGTLGTPLVKELKKRGHKVWQVDLTHEKDENYIRADIVNYRQLEKVFEIDYDYVYLLAAEFGRINGEEYYENLWKTNVIGTRNILEWQKKKGFKLIFSSSSEIYGGKSWGLLKEDLPMEKSLIQHNDYATTKWVNEIQIMNFEKRFNLESMRVRIFNTYGPGEHYNNYRSVVCLFCYRSLFKIPYTVFNGYTRSFMYIDDFIKGFANCCEYFKSGEVYNIGGFETRSITDLNDIILKYVNVNSNLIEYRSEDFHNTQHKYACIEKAKKDLKYNPVTTLEIGIPKTIEWMKKEYNINE